MTEYKSAKELYEAAYSLAQEKGFDPMITGDWNLVHLLVGSLAPTEPQLVDVACRLWQIDSNTYSVRDIVELAAGRGKTVSERAITKYVDRGVLKPLKRVGRSHLFSKREVEKLMSNPRFGTRGNRNEDDLTT